MSPSPTPKLAFSAVRGQEQREAVGRFLMAQGWSGLHLGDQLLREPPSPSPGETGLLVLWGAEGEPRAAALVGRSRIQVLAPVGADRACLEQLIANRREGLERVVGVEGQLPPDLGPEFEAYARVMTVAAVLRLPARQLPGARPARRSDAASLHRIYGHVDWMRLGSAAEWAERMERERTWVVEVEGRAVAAARWTKRFGRMVEIGGVATEPSRRRRGAATAVVLAATAAALVEGLTPVLCFMDEELGALYHPLGFERVGREMVFQRRQ